MATYIPVVTEIGTLRGRDAIYLDTINFSDQQNVLTLRGKFNCQLASMPSEEEWQVYQMRFLGIVTLQMTELDAWEAMQGGSFPQQSSFDEVVDSPWLAHIRGKTSHNLRHYVLQTYDHVFEVVCDSHELKLG